MVNKQLQNYCHDGYLKAVTEFTGEVHALSSVERLPLYLQVQSPTLDRVEQSGKTARSYLDAVDLGVELWRTT